MNLLELDCKLAKNLALSLILGAPLVILIGISYTTAQEQSIPSWIKNNAGWWANGQISDDEFVKGIQWLISNGIIKINS